MIAKNLFIISDQFIDLFNKNNYETFVLDLLNLSKVVFKGSYSKVEDQSAGQCDFIDSITGEKYDAKLPFKKEQIKLLTDGKKHKPEIEKWINEMHIEAAEYNPIFLRDNPDSIEDLKLYTIMKEQILRDKEDENIVFFLPYPVSLSDERSIFLQFASDYVSLIFERLKEKFDLEKRTVNIIYPSSEKNKYVLRSTNDSYYKEYISYDKIGKYFSYEVVGMYVSKE